MDKMAVFKEEGSVSWSRKKGQKDNRKASTGQKNLHWFIGGSQSLSNLFKLIDK